MSGEKTEQPTHKKLDDARKKGQVPKSKEVVSASLITGIFVILWVMADSFVEDFSSMMLAPSNHLHNEFLVTLSAVSNDIFMTSVQIIAPFLLIVFIFGIGGNFIQIGALFTVEPIIPKLEKLDPMKALKNIFSLKNLVELVKSIVKIAVLSILITWVVLGGIDDLLKAPSCGVTCLLAVFGSLMKKIIIVTIISFVIIAVFDLFFQRWQFNKDQMMTKDEVKREYKEMEGSPEIKSKRKQFHREIMNDSSGPKPQQAQESSVLVTNPTHIAVGLFYDKERAPIPYVNIKGKGVFAEEMMRIARENDVPIIQNIDLARALFKDVEMNQVIPAKYFKPIAEIVAWLNQIKADKEAF